MVNKEWLAHLSKVYNEQKKTEVGANMRLFFTYEQEIRMERNEL